MNSKFLITLSLTTLVLATASPPGALADDAANEALARRFYTEFNARNFDAFDDFIAADVVDRTAPPDHPVGVAALKAELQGFASAFSDMQIENEKVLVTGDYVTVVSRATGTNDGPMMEVPATNKPVNFQAIDVWLVQNGKLAEVWHVEQLLQMYGQLGLLGGGSEASEDPAAAK